MQANTATRSTAANLNQTEAQPPFNFFPHFVSAFPNNYISLNPSYIELPEARAEDLTPRSGWKNKLDIIEKKYLEEKEEKTQLHEIVQQLRLQISTIESTAHINLEQLSVHIVSLEREIESYKSREEDLKGQVKARDDYIITVKATIKENEDKYLRHLETIKREYEKLEDVNKQLNAKISALNEENQSLKLQFLEARNEMSKTQGIRDTEKTLFQNQLKEAQAELLKVNNKCYEITRELDKTKFVLDETSAKFTKIERELIYKENEIRRLEELVKAAEEKLKSDDRNFEKTLSEKIMTVTNQIREDRSDAETKYKLEQKTSFELKVQLEELRKAFAKLSQEYQELNSINKINEEKILKAEILENETQQQLASLKAKYDAHFARVDEAGFNKELRFLQSREELESLKAEKEYHERLIFQYQNFLKLYNLDYEFNGLTRVDKGNFSTQLVGMKHEAREKAAREYYLKNEEKKYSEQVRGKYQNFDEGTQKQLEVLKKEMDNVGDYMEDEWKNLFTRMSEFKTKINL